jgi:photosystem II stability/assembly factor-like uncharacterized protein
MKNQIYAILFAPRMIGITSLSRNPIFMKKRKFISMLLFFFVFNRLLGQSWFRMIDPGSNLLEQVFILPNGELAIGDIQGVNISNDSAATWTKTLVSYNVFNVKATDRLFAMGGYNGAFLYVSKETGTSWKNIANSEIHRPYIVQVAERSPNELFALATWFGGDGSQLYRTTNIGTSWDSTSGMDCPYFKTLIAGTGSDLYGLSNSGGFYRSTDDGATWIKSSIGITSNELTSLVVARNDTLYVGTSRKTLYQSPDKGLSWQAVANPFPDSSALSYMVVSSTGALYVAASDSSNTTFYRSNNGGRNWTAIGSPLFTPTFYSMTVTKQGSIIARADYHIYTNDSSFIPLGDQMPKITVTSPAEGAIWSAESQQVITWTSVNVTTYVFLALSTDEGLSWDWLNGGSPVPNSGIYHITVPNTPSTACKIKMTSMSDWYYDWFNPGYFTIGKGESVITDPSSKIPKSYELSQNYPNPFNPSTTIQFQVPAAADVELVVMDVRGQKVATLAGRRFDAGAHSIQWNGLDEGGRLVPCGVYMVVLKSNGFRDVKKLVLIK